MNSSFPAIIGFSEACWNCISAGTKKNTQNAQSGSWKISTCRYRKVSNLSDRAGKTHGKRGSSGASRGRDHRRLAVVHGHWLCVYFHGCAGAVRDAVCRYARACAVVGNDRGIRQIDVEKSSLQTHATLSALRGILRLCEAEPRMRNCSRLQKKCSRTMCSTE